MQNSVEIKNLCVSYQNTDALSNISFSVEKGQYVGIIGPNGGGKSTLLKVLSGLITEYEGMVSIFGGCPRKTQCSIGYVPQFSKLNRKFPITVFEAVLSARLKKSFPLFRHYSAEDKDIATLQIEKMGIKELKNRSLSELSGGEFQRMLIARALATNPDILLMDEPTASVDIASKKTIFDLMDELHSKMTILLVTHDLSPISSSMDSIACINQQLVYFGKPQLDAEILGELYGHSDLIFNNNLTNLSNTKQEEPQ